MMVLLMIAALASAEKVHAIVRSSGVEVSELYVQTPTDGRVVRPADVEAAAAAFLGAAVALAVAGRVRRRGAYRGAAADVELGGGADPAGGAAEVVFATGGARPDLDAVVKRADEQLGADADVMLGGPQPLIDGLEGRLRLEKVLLVFVYLGLHFLFDGC